MAMTSASSRAMPTRLLMLCTLPLVNGSSP